MVHVQDGREHTVEKTGGVRAAREESTSFGRPNFSFTPRERSFLSGSCDAYSRPRFWNGGGRIRTRLVRHGSPLPPPVVGVEREEEGGKMRMVNSPTIFAALCHPTRSIRHQRYFVQFFCDSKFELVFTTINFNYGHV